MRTKCLSMLLVRFQFSSFLFVLLACSGERPRERMCNVEQLNVAWPVTVQRRDGTTSEQLSATLARGGVEREVFDSLEQALVHGRSAPAIVWSVPAFNTDPGGIAVLHSGQLVRGTVMRVAGVLDGGGWGLMPAVPRDSALVIVEAGEFTSQSVAGTITVLATRPVALRLDLTAADSAGDSIRLTGDARFSSRRVRERCSVLAGGR
jgi:hypothetical protein